MRECCDGVGRMGIRGVGVIVAPSLSDRGVGSSLARDAFGCMVKLDGI